MANGMLPSHIIELDDTMDNNENERDADLVALRIAASRAQNAALRYEARTTSMKTSFSASILETRDQSPPTDSRSPSQYQEQELERNHERERSSCDEDERTPSPRTESPELGSPDGYYDVNRVVQPTYQAIRDIPLTRTKSPIFNLETGEDRLSAVNVIALERSHHTEGAMSEPRPQAVPSVESENAQKRCNRTSSPDGRMKNIPRKKARRAEDAASANRMTRMGSQSPPSHTEEFDAKDEHNLLITVFRTDIYPLIKTACSHHPKIRSKEQAHTVGRAVSTEVVNDELRNQLRNSGYRISDMSRKKLKRAIYNSLDRISAPLPGETSCRESSPAESSFGMVLPNPPGVGHYGPGEPSIGLHDGPDLFHGTPGTSVDLSLLGPGETSSNPNLSRSVASTEKSQGLSLRSNVVQVPNLGTEFHGKLPESASPPKSKRLNDIPPTAVSLHGESRIPNPNTATSLGLQRSPDTAAANRINQKPWHCVCGKKYRRAGGLKSHRAHSVPCNNGLSLREAMTVGVDQHERVPSVEKRVSLLPLLDESMSSGINISAQPSRRNSSEHDYRTFSSSTAYMAGNMRSDILSDSGPLQGCDAALCRGVEVDRYMSESAASPSLLPPVGLLSLPRSSSASGSFAGKALATSVTELNHHLVEGKQVGPFELRSPSPDLRETQELFESEGIEAVGGGLSGEEAGTLPGTLDTNSVGGSFALLPAFITPTQLSSAGGENSKRENTKGENTKGKNIQGGTLARKQKDTRTVSSCAKFQTLPSQSHVSPFEHVTTSNNGISTSTGVLPHHPKALARTLLDKTTRSSQTSRFVIPRRESKRRYKSGVATDKITPSLRSRAPLNYHPDPDCKSPSSDTFESLPPIRADGLTTTGRQQSVEKRADPQHATHEQIVSQLSDEVLDSIIKLGISGGADQGVVKEYPYLSVQERNTSDIRAERTFDLDMVEGDEDKIIHMDFEDREYEELLQAAYKTLKTIKPQDTQLSARLRLTEIMKNTSEEDRVLIRKRAQQKGSVIERRNEKDVESLLKDASHGALPEHPRALRINTVIQPIRRARISLLTRRNGGFNLPRKAIHSSAKAINRELRIRLSEGLTAWKTWSDASNDVLVVAWSPNGSTYAVGASAQTDPASAQYNKRNNLLLGDLDSNTLRELPDHHIDRPIPEDGTGTQWALYNACDPLLQTTVTATRFSTAGDRMYTASYDCTVKVWDVSQRGKPFVVDTLEHDAEVELAATSHVYPAVLATGSRTREDSIRVYYSPGSGDAHGAAYNCEVLSSSRSKKHASEELYPSSLQWGTTSETSGLLLAGFSPKVNDDTEDCGQNGEVCLWDLGDGQAIKLAPSSQNVFDATWHPNLPIFATGSTPLRSNRASPKTRSVVRVYEPLRSSYSTVEYECPAFDINDVTFAPYNVNYISAGCTDGITYVWDYRMPDKVMLRLRHGEPLAESHPYLAREQHDTGVRFTSWGLDGQYLYTGSSDGFIKQWDIRRAAKDALVRDVTQLKGGVMCGAFSPDYSNILVGDDTAGIHILTTAPTGQRRYIKEDGYEEGNLITERIPFIYAPQNQRSTTAPDIPEADEEDMTCYGTMIANAALATGELSMHPIFGAGKGPKYSGPYSLEARPEGTTEDDARTVALLPNEQALQLGRCQRKKARKQGWKAKKAEQEIIKEQVKIAWLRNVTVEFSNHWGDKYVKERDETLVKQFKEGADVVQLLKELKLQHSGARDAEVTDLQEGSTSKHAKDDEESDQDGVMRKKSKHRHSKVKSDDNDLFITHSINVTKSPPYRQVGNLVILDSDSEEESHPTPNIEKYYDPRDVWLPQEHNQILFEDAEDSWFISREAEREQIFSEAVIEEAKRRQEQERKRVQDARAAEEKRKVEEARAKLLAGK